MRTLRAVALAAFVVLAVAGAGTAPAAGQAPGAEAALTGAVDLDGGNVHTCAVVGGGRVRCWGDNSFGQLGDGTTTMRNRAVLVRLGGGSPLTGAVQVVTGVEHSCALLGDGRVRCWGGGLAGQLGDGTSSDRPNPVFVRKVSGPGQLGGVTQLSAGFRHTCARVSSGEARCWGDNTHGQLSVAGGNSARPVRVLNSAGTVPLDRLASIGAGDRHTCALLLNGRVRCWGDNESGQLGDGTGVDSLGPVLVDNVAGTDVLRNVDLLSVGAYHACAQLADRTVRCWGSNSTNQLGDGTTDLRLRPVRVLGPSGSGSLGRVRTVVAGNLHSCALLLNSQVRCWGFNGQGAVGDGTFDSRPFPATTRNGGDTGPLSGVQALGLGDFQTCAVLGSGAVRCWGGNVFDQLGTGTSGGSSPLPQIVVT